MRKRLVSLLFAGIMACSVIGSGVTTFAAENDSHINLALFTYIEGMDPATDWCGWNLTRCGVGETLVTVNENMEIVGQLADEWEQVDDTTYRFHIRQGVKFSNGTELTPEIVKDSIQRSIDNNSRGGDLKIANIEVDGENVVFTTDGEYIHKRCGLLLRGIVYHLQGSIFAKKSENDTETYLRSFIQFVLPRTECLGLVESTRLRCQVCGKKAGFMVRCSVKGCGSVIIGTLNDL